MSPAMMTHLTLGYVACLLCFGAYIWPWLKHMEAAEPQRVIATLHSFRFFGLVFILPGVVGPGRPAALDRSRLMGISRQVCLQFWRC